MSRRYEKVAFVASPSPEALEAHARLVAHYGNCEPEAADVVVALGGDGFMLQTLRVADADRQAGLRHASGHHRLSDE